MRDKKNGFSGSLRFYDCGNFLLRLCVKSLQRLIHDQNITTGKTKEEITGFLKKMELDDIAGKPVSEYSGGMKRRVAIARALLAEYDILIMDEPLQGLDAETKEKVATVIKTQTAGKTVLLFFRL